MTRHRGPFSPRCCGIEGCGYGSRTTEPTLPADPRWSRDGSRFLALLAGALVALAVGVEVIR